MSGLIRICRDFADRSYANVRGHHGYLQFVILGHARTGSNYLFAGLNTSRSIKLHHEIFSGHSRKIGSNFEQILSRVYRKERKTIKAVGFKLFYNHLTESEWTSFVRKNTFSIIHLTRHNRLRTIVSLEIALKTDQWSQTSVTGRLIGKKIRLDPSHLLARIEAIENQENLARSRLHKWRTLEITYERLVGRPYEWFQEIGGFLDVDDICTHQIDLLKQNPENLETLIENYDEVYEILKGTKYFAYVNR